MINGERDAFREFARIYSRQLFQAAYSVLRSVKDAEDATQEALIKIYESLPQYRNQGFKTWITRIAVNKAIDYKRSKNRKREDFYDEPEQYAAVAGANRSSPVEHSLLQQEQSEVVRRQIEQLPDGYRQVVTAFYMEEKSCKQISEEQNITINTVKSKLYRAKQFMQKHWKEEELR